MKKMLLQLAKDYNITECNSVLRDKDFDENNIIRSLHYFNSKYHNEIILYGGQTATSKFYGFKRMRSITNDIDFVCTKPGIRMIASNENVRYHKGYDVFYMVQFHIPVTFTYYHIHEWLIDNDFFKSTVTIPVDLSNIRCCSPEYTILLKLMRLCHCIDCHRNLFGKDAIDILNIVTAPFFIDSLKPIDFSMLKLLINTYLVIDKSKLSEIFEFIVAHKHHLTKHEVPVFDENIPEKITFLLAS